MFIINTGNSKIFSGALRNAAGYPMPDTEKEFGLKRPDLYTLFDIIIKNKEYTPSEDEWIMIGKSIKACLKYIDDWEFPAVFDVDITKADVQKFYDKYFSDTPGVPGVD